MKSAIIYIIVFLALYSIYKFVSFELSVIIGVSSLLMENYITNEKE